MIPLTVSGTAVLGADCSLPLLASLLCIGSLLADLASTFLPRSTFAFCLRYSRFIGSHHFTHPPRSLRCAGYLGMTSQLLAGSCNFNRACCGSVTPMSSQLLSLLRSAGFALLHLLTQGYTLLSIRSNYYQQRKIAKIRKPAPSFFTFFSPRK
jgi:hypothetical protein